MTGVRGVRGASDEPSGPPIGGRYEVVRVLGQGAFGQTLLCQDERTGGRVAVKELRFAHLTDWKDLELFEREATVLSRLEHSSIPRVLDFFEDRGDSTVAYIVQEFVEGVSLQQRIDTGPMLAQLEVREVALGILDVLEYLHGRAPPVLHRDIKPANILLRPGGEVALVDFGGVLSGWRMAGEMGATVVGTFGYMPPEQLVGQAGPASDLYALGATLLHALTGRPPGDFPFESGRIEVPENLPADRELARLIPALLRPAARDRPRSAAEARRLLLEGGPGLGSFEPSTVRVRTTARRTSQLAPGSGAGPRFVDLGPPPRDPEGEFRDVYANLVNPLFPHRRLWSATVHGFWISFAVIVSVVSVGVAPILYRRFVAERRRRYTDVFRDGRFTPGMITASSMGATYATFTYEFEAGGAVYVAFMEYAQELTRYWGPGAEIPVLYDPADPHRSCFVYR